jgi:hypothetical protein
MRKLIKKVLSRDEFFDNPPVLFDIGASGRLNPKWKILAQYSICIAFDADDRQMNHIDVASNRFKRLHVFNAVLTDKARGNIPFYLTKSPYCSSVLKPDRQSLQNLLFADSFEVEQKTEMNSIDLPSVMNQLELKGIDWFKTDSQGTDLRLFKSLDDEIIKKVLVAEFEPGIIDAYQGEDKLYDVLAFMDGQPFWMSDIKILGTQRIKEATVTRYFNKIERRLFSNFLRVSPGWAEVTFINTLQQESLFNLREFLLGWIFATLNSQHGYALDLALRAAHEYTDPIFIEMADDSIKQMKKHYIKLPAFIIEGMVKKIVRLFYQR